MAADPSDPGARFLRRWEVHDVTGPVVAIDVIRAFTTAAYAFAAGAAHLVLADSVEEALAYKVAHPNVLAMGEDRGRKPEGFDYSNSPVAISRADLIGRVLVQRTTAGTRGVVAARSATRLWAASLVCASATAAVVRESGLGPPTYVITGAADPTRSEGRSSTGADDLAAAHLIERARLGLDLRIEQTVAAIRNSEEAARTLTLGHGHVDPDDIVFATRVDAFDFAMEVHRVGDELQLHRVDP